MEHNRKAIVIGATGGIGGAFMAALEADERFGKVVGLSRRSDPPVDLIDESSLEAAAEALKDDGPFGLIVIATGVLTPDGGKPEKNLRHLDPERLAAVMAVNAIGPALAVKHFHRLLPREGTSVIAALSARVGSIGDNGLGGWYGYRASKAALNQFLRTAAVEIARKRPEAAVLALHPGTVETDLSADFTAGRDTVWPAEAAARLLDVIESATPAMSGGFYDYSGREIPW